jgi:hypothetical protein
MPTFCLSVAEFAGSRAPSCCLRALGEVIHSGVRACALPCSSCSCSNRNDSRRVAACPSAAAATSCVAPACAAATCPEPPFCMSAAADAAPLEFTVARGADTGKSAGGADSPPSTAGQLHPPGMPEAAPCSVCFGCAKGAKLASVPADVVNSDPVAGSPGLPLPASVD